MNFRNAIAMPLIAASCLVSAAWADDDFNAAPKNVVYVHTNNPLPDKNSILAYERNPSTGVLTEIHGSPFSTGGTGLLNPEDILGPDDSDQELVASPDHRFLYVTNQGSNTISGFAIQPDGSLRNLPGSPFPSGGVQPVSIGIDGAFLFVVNRGDDTPGIMPGTHAPTYASFLILPEGSLLPLPLPQPPMALGASPSQALIAPGGKLMFDAHLLEDPFTIPPGFPPFVPPASSELHSYKVVFGSLIPAAMTAPPSPIPPFILGLQVHPTEHVLYAGYVVAGLLATYTYDDNGNMTLVATTPSASSISGLCWIALSPDAQYLYTADAITDQIDVFSIANPVSPVKIQSLTLGGPKNPGDFPTKPNIYDTTPFQLQASTDGRFVFVVDHEVNDPVGSATGNALHILKKGTGGMLTEVPTSPLVFPLNEVPMTAHPAGVVVF